jgi:Icc-related predicted phosphoesterase
VVVYAGDIGENVVKNFKWMAKQLNGRQAIYIFGNHEYYNGTYSTKLEIAEELAKEYTNIHFLNNNFVTINGVNFYGTTLWTNFNNRNPLNMTLAQMYMNDYQVIKYIKHENKFKLTTYDVANIHDTELSQLKNFLDYKKGEKNVIVSHHAPSSRSVNPKYKGDNLNAAYYSDLDYLFDYEPKLWIHGHMHDAIHYVAGKTQVVCNPGGYFPWEFNKNGFNPNMLIKV